MIRLKVFISSEQKELREERSALGGLLATNSLDRVRRNSDQAHRAQIRRKDIDSGANQARVGRKTSASGAKQKKSTEAPRHSGQKSGEKLTKQ